MKKVNKSTKRKIIGRSIAAFLLVYSIISMITCIVIYNGQFPRYDRHDMNVSAGLRYEDLEDTYPRKLVSFKSGENLLQGYVYGKEDAKALVVVVHGLGGGADSYLPQITYFVDHGWQVFSYDATGSFDSEGKTTKGFPQALLDLNSTLSYLETQSDSKDKPILLFGHSWGGYAAANILHDEQDIAAVVSVSGANSSKEMIMEQGEKIMGSFIKLQYPYLWLYEQILFGRAASYRAEDALRRTEVPTFIVHGTEDEMVGYHQSSIISKIRKLDHPYVKTLTIDEPGRSGHMDLFRSKASMDYISEVNEKYREIYDAYDSNIPYDVKKEFYAKIDRTLAQDLNLNLMEEINSFYLESLKAR